jgi:hypothetical protein
MNPFARFGIKHLSASSLRTYREEPALWVLQYLHRIRDEGGPGAWRGTAVEAGLNHYLLGQPEYATKAMHVSFEERASGVADDQIHKEREALPMFLSQAREALKDKPPLQPKDQQFKITLELPGIEVPLIGYVDYLWDDHGVDLKTTWRMPSEPQPAHVEQMSCYMRATGRPFHLCYVTPKKWSLHEVSKDMADEAFERVLRGARAIRSFLSRVESPDDAMTLFSPEFEGYRWSPAHIEAAASVYKRLGAMP